MADKTDNIPTRQQIINYYSSDFICSQMVANSRGREVAAAFPDGRYDKRPNIIQYQSDVVQMARKGITSFHLSTERWSNPMGLIAENYDLLRTGWDFVLDIDSKLGVDEAKIAALLITKLLRKYGIKDYSVKFSGRRGFHVVVPWEMFPKEVNYKPTAVRYPEMPRILARFIRRKIAKRLLAKLMTLQSARDFVSVMNEQDQMNPFYLIEVEKDWGNRHMFRAPYSINEKTWLVSLPIEKISGFRREQAAIENALKSTSTVPFFHGEEGEASDLLTDAVDWYASVRKEEKPKTEVKKIRWEKKIPEESFPPCITAMLGGMQDGKKRSIFTLVNFLRMMNWTQDEIEQRIIEWNKKNAPPLPTSAVLSHLRYHEKRDTVPPANCDSGMYYIDIGLCRPDVTCKRGSDRITVKNPINYPFRKMNLGRKDKGEKPQARGFSCLCGKEFKTMRALEMHKGRSH